MWPLAVHAEISSSGIAVSVSPHGHEGHAQLEMVALAGWDSSQPRGSAPRWPDRTDPRRVGCADRHLRVDRQWIEFAGIFGRGECLVDPCPVAGEHGWSLRSYHRDRPPAVRLPARVPCTPRRRASDTGSGTGRAPGARATSVSSSCIALRAAASPLGTI